MKELNRYVKQKNEFNALFRGNYYDLRFEDDRQSIASSLESDLSPENLTCDGELPYVQVMARKRFLEKAQTQLRSMMEVA
jgi:hypothetical protein